MWYILAHWRGELGIVKSSLLNGVALFLLLAYVEPGAFVLAILSRATDARVDLTGDVLLVFFALCMTWSIVGVFRRGLRYSSNRTNGITVRIAGGVVATAALLTPFFMVGGLYHWARHG